MNKLILITCISLIPFLSFAQKNNKNKNQDTFENISHEYMIIRGFTINDSQSNSTNKIAVDIRGEERLKIIFDYGSLKVDEALLSKQYRTMGHALNASTKFGWEFISANVISSGQNNKEFFYYMKRQKR